MSSLRWAAPALLLLAASCAGSDGRSMPATSDSARDDFGEVIPFGALAQRIVSLNPTTTELLFTIGAGDRVVGRTHWDISPPAARAVPDLGDGIRPNIEAVLGARPDLVLLYASADNRPAYDRIRQAGIATVALKLDRIADFRRGTLLIGRLAGASATATTLVDSVMRTLARVSSETRALPRPRVFLHAWNRPVMAIGGGSFMTELVAIAGGRNIYDSIPAPAAPVTIEDVVRRDPDIVLAGPEAVTQILADPSWRVLRAVREGRVLAYDTNLVYRPSVRLGEAAVSLQHLLHQQTSRAGR